MAAKQQNRKLGMESLEKREVCAGNVLVFIDSAGGLNLMGDGNSNQVEVMEDSAYKKVFTIKGLYGTTINGRSETAFYAQADSMYADLGRGDDMLVMRRASFSQLNVNTGTGRDDVWMHGAFVYGRGNSANFNLGGAETDRDTLNLHDAYFNGNLNVELGAGDDTAVFNNANVYDYLNVSAGTGYDTYYWKNSSYGKPWQWSGFDQRTF